MTLHKPLDLPYIHSVYDGVPQPKFITAERYEEIRTRHVNRTDDVYIATFMKSGTTWLQFIVYELLGRPQGDYDQINLAVPWLQEESQQLIDVMASPRVLKTHDKWKWIPKGDGLKYIYCYRNPKDIAVSYYHHMKMFEGHYAFEGTFDSFMDHVFLKYNSSEQGSVFEHVAEWLEQKDNTNILFLTYEDMVEDLRRELKRIAHFLNVSLSDERLEAIALSGMFSSMQKNGKLNYSWREGVSIKGKSTFIRKGKVGDWVNFLTEGHSKEIERLVEKHLTPLGANIRYTLDES